MISFAEIEAKDAEMHYYYQRSKEVIPRLASKYKIKYHRAAHALEQLKIARDLYNAVIYYDTPEIELYGSPR